MSCREKWRKYWKLSGMSLFDTEICDKVIAIKRVDGSKPSALFYYREKEESI